MHAKARYSRTLDRKPGLTSHLPRALSLTLAAIVLMTSGGCIARMLDFGVYLVKGPPLVPAEYRDLEGQRVAVICVSVANSYGPNAVTNRIHRNLQRRLSAKIVEIDVVREAEVADWLDHHDWTNIDYHEVGRGVKADKVLVVELNRPLELREGPNLYRGMADFTVTVMDINQGGEKVFRRRVEEFRWPAQARYGVSESKFEQAFSLRIAERVGQFFYGVEANSDIGENTSDVGGFE